MRRISATNSSGRPRDGGYTILELIIVMVPALLLTAIVVGLLIDMISENTRAFGKTNMAYNMQSSLNFITDDINGATRFLETKEAGFIDNYGPDNNGGAWSYKGTSATNRVLIMRTIATTLNTRDPAKEVVYINQLGCDADNLTNNPPLTVNTIYFIRNSMLHRRTLTDTSKTICGTLNYHRQSCPRDVVGTLKQECKSFDVPLVGGVTSFTVDYYDVDGAYLDVYSSSVLLSSAQTVEVKIKTQEKISGKNETYEGSIKLSKLNE